MTRLSVISLSTTPRKQLPLLLLASWISLSTIPPLLSPSIAQQPNSQPTHLPITSDKESQADSATLDKLEQYVDVDFQEATLQNVLDHFAKSLNLQYYFDRRTFEEEGIAIDEPNCSLKLKAIPVRMALEILLGEEDLTYMIRHGVLKISTNEVAQRMENLVLRIYPVNDLLESARNTHADGDPAKQSAADATSQKTSRSDWLEGAIHAQFGGLGIATSGQMAGGPGYGGMGDARTASLMQLMDVVMNGVDPDSWEDTGDGNATIDGFRTTLSIRQTIQNHQQIERLLQKLREATRGGSARQETRETKN